MNQLYGILSSGVNAGIKREMPEGVLNHINQNVYVFSGAKTYEELNELKDLLLDDDKNIKSFHQFWQESRKIHTEYNQSYLKAEYNFATHAARAADQWQDIAADGDEYNLQYRTANDGLVRESHFILHDTTLPPSDPFWDKYFPPNGWNCRCLAVQVRKSKYPLSDSKEAIEKGDKATTVIGKNGHNSAAMFRFNPGKQEIIFPETHPHFKALSKEEKKAVEKMHDSRKDS